MPLKSPAAVRVLTLVILGGSSAACDDSTIGVPPEGSVDLATPWVRATPESVGLDENALYLFSRPSIATPGETLIYNSAAVHLLGAILEKAVGRSVPDYADDVLFRPLGIRQRSWEELSSGYVNGSAGLALRPRDLAKIGQLYLQEGWSESRPVVPAAWVSEATTPRWASLGPAGPIENLSYGYLWWVDLDRGSYLAWGFAGQLIYVVPALDLVVVATTEWRGVRQDIGNQVLQEAVLGLIVNNVLRAIR